MYHVTKSQAASALKMEQLHRLQVLRQKNEIYERQYGSFEQFERELTEQEEDFRRWDDYMEWKAYRQELAETEQHVEELKRVDIDVA
jgi:hypothetical protein